MSPLYDRLNADYRPYNVSLRLTDLQDAMNPPTPESQRSQWSSAFSAAAPARAFKHCIIQWLRRDERAAAAAACKSWNLLRPSQPRWTPLPEWLLISCFCWLRPDEMLVASTACRAWQSEQLFAVFQREFANRPQSSCRCRSSTQAGRSDSASALCWSATGAAARLRLRSSTLAAKRSDSSFPIRSHFSDSTSSPL